MRCAVNVLCAIAVLVPGADANVCASGSMQSPIDFDVCTKNIEGDIFNVPMERPKLNLNYQGSIADLKTECVGNQCYLKMTPVPINAASKLTVPGIGSYELKNCVVRIPSEHTVNNNRYDMEVQCYHSMVGTDNRRQGVLSVLYEVTPSASPFVSMLEDNMPVDAISTKTGVGVNFNVVRGKASTSRYYSYKGSNTIGNCEEDADWYVMYDPVTISQAQLDKMKATQSMTSNSKTWAQPRALQKAYGRQPQGCIYHAPDAGAAVPTSIGALSVAIVVLSFFSQA